MKRITAIIAVMLSAALLFCGCAKNMSRLNYNYKTSKMVELDSYEVEVDSSSEEYKEIYAEKLSSLLRGKLTKGTVKEGDTANIDYVGKKDGVAFEGGTAKGYDLVIGSDSFIDGFEDGLVGVEIGSTVDLNLTFPKEYDSAELAGKAVVFTVTVNYVVRELDELNDENAKLFGFGSASEIEKQAVTYAKESVAWNTVYDNAKASEYPEKETEKYIEFLYTNLEMTVLSNYGITLEQYISYSGTTEESLRNEIRSSEQLEAMKHNYLVAYYVLDKEGVKITPDMIDATIKELGASTTKISRDYFEAVTALEKAIVLVGEKATLK